MSDFVQVKSLYDRLSSEKISLESKLKLLEKQKADLLVEIKEFGMDPDKLQEEIEAKQIKLETLKKKAEDILKKLEEDDG